MRIVMSVRILCALEQALLLKYNAPLSRICSVRRSVVKV